MQEQTEVAMVSTQKALKRKEVGTKADVEGLNPQMLEGKRKKDEVRKRTEIDGKVMKAGVTEDEGEGLSLEMMIEVRQEVGVLKSPANDLMKS